MTITPKFHAPFFINIATQKSIVNQLKTHKFDAI